MKICYVCYWDLSYYEAVSIHIFGIADNLCSMGHDVTVFAPDIGRYPYETQAKVVYLPAPPGGKYGILSYNITLFSALVKFIISSRPDCIYVREISMFATPWILGRILRIPVYTETSCMLVNISNFHAIMGGFSYPLLLGTEDQIIQAHNRERYSDFFVLGIIFIMGLYHLGLFYQRRVSLNTLSR